MVRRQSVDTMLIEHYLTLSFSIILYSACLWIASKVQDKNPPSSEDFVYISDHSFTDETLRSVEARICKELGFRLMRVTPLNFLNNFLKASYACNAGTHCQYDNAVLRQLTMYLLALSRISCDLSVKKPSLVAAASLYLARVTLGLRETNMDHRAVESCYWTRTLIHYTGYTTAELKETVLMIHRYHLAAETGEATKACFLKYKKAGCLGVSLKTVPLLESLQL
jgi:Cyclin, C-terminal domain/Cyclin, N-terminal domain